MDRKEFLKTAAAGLIAASVPSVALRAVSRSPHKRPKRHSGRLSLAFEPYDLKLIHPFTVAVNTRTHTPDVQVTLEYDGITGYGEASMPPYLGETQESVCRFLGSLDLSRFADPFRMDEILDYVDRLLPTTGRPKLRSIWRCTIWSASCSDNRGTRYGVCRPKRRPTPRSRSASTRPRSSGKKSRKRLPTT